MSIEYKRPTRDERKAKIVDTLYYYHRSSGWNTWWSQTDIATKMGLKRTPYLKGLLEELYVEDKIRVRVVENPRGGCIKHKFEFALPGSAHDPGLL